jgi:hypothetical protein
MTGRRSVAAVLVALALLTLAPRTSEVLDNGWSVVRVSEQVKGRVSTVTFWAMPPRPVPATSRIPVFVDGGSWTLVAAPPGSAAETDAVVCVLDAEDVRRKHLITVAVRASGPVSFSFVPPGV